MAGNPNPSPATRFTSENQPADKGRATRKGARDRLSKAFLEELAEDFALHGKATVAKVRTEEPAKYLKLIGDLQKTEIEISTPESTMSDAELQTVYDLLLAGVTPTKLEEAVTDEHPRH